MENIYDTKTHSFPQIPGVFRAQKKVFTRYGGFWKTREMVNIYIYTVYVNMFDPNIYDRFYKCQAGFLPSTVVGFAHASQWRVLYKQYQKDSASSKMAAAVQFTSLNSGSRIWKYSNMCKELGAIPYTW